MRTDSLRNFAKAPNNLGAVWITSNNAANKIYEYLLIRTVNCKYQFIISSSKLSCGGNVWYSTPVRIVKELSSDNLGSSLQSAYIRY